VAVAPLLPNNPSSMSEIPANLPLGNLPLANLDEYTGYLAAEGFDEPLLEEIGGADLSVGRLHLKAGPPLKAAWAANIWHHPRLLTIASIGDGAKQLRDLQRNWVAYSPHLHRRSTLLQDKLPKVSAKPLVFGAPAPSAPLGSWCLLDETHLIAAPECSSPFPHGEALFVEDREAPPSRAYLKLWEGFTRFGVAPKPGALCLDLGASPGGWTWVLAGLGARVISVDKAPLEPRIAAMAGVTCLKQSAFALEPATAEPVDWLFSDVICYPERLYRLVQAWREAGKARNFFCTLKFQGPTDHETARLFAAIPGSQLCHLHCNKHELTWLLVDPNRQD